MRRSREDSPPFSLFAFQDIVTAVTGIMILVTLLIAVELLLRQESSPKHQTKVVNQDLQAQIRETELAVQRLQGELNERAAQGGGEALLDAATLEAQLGDTRQQVEFVTQERQALASRLKEAGANLRQFEQKERERQPELEVLERLRAELEEKQRQLENLTTSNRLVYNPDERTTKTQWLVEIDSSRLAAARMGIASRPQSFAEVADFKRWADARSPASDRFMLVLKPDAVKLFPSVVSYLDGRGFQFGYDLVSADQVVIDPEHGAGL